MNELDVLGVVAQPADVLAPAEVPQPEPRLPRHRHDAPVGGDPRQLGHGRRHRRQVLEDLDAGDQVGAPRRQGQHARVADHRRHRREAGGRRAPCRAGTRRRPPGRRPSGDASTRSRHRPSPTPTSTIVPDTVPTTPRRRPGPAVEQAADDGVGRPVLGGVLAGGLERRARGEADRPPPLGRGGHGRSGRPRCRPRSRRVRVGVAGQRAAPEVHAQLGEQAEQDHLQGDHHEQHARRAAPGACRPGCPRCARRASTRAGPTPPPP